jgi:SAM-dependent methyltransferase
LPYPDATFDILLSYEAISHYNDVAGFLNEAWRVLKPGGVLMISDGNNGLNPLIRYRTRRLWEAAENGPEGRVVCGHRVGKTYVRARAEMLRSRFPQLDESTIDMLARRTSGLFQSQVIAEGQRFVAEGVLPAREYRSGELSVDPADGEVMERLFNPFALARQMRAVGFRTRAHGYWGGANGRRAIRFANRLLTAVDPALAPTARGFRVSGTK